MNVVAPVLLIGFVVAVYAVAALFTSGPVRRWTSRLGGVVVSVLIAAIVGMFWFSPPMYRVLPEDQHVIAVAGPDDDVLIVAGTDEVFGWNVASRRRAETFAPLAARATCLAFDTQHKRLAIGDRNRTVTIRAFPGGRELFSFRTGMEEVHVVAFSPDGSLLAVGGNGPPILELRDAGTGELVDDPLLWFAADGERHDFLERAGGEINAVAFHPDGDRLAMAKPNTAFVCDLGSGEVSLFPGGERDYSVVAYSPDGRYLAVGDSYDRFVQLWDVETGEKVFEDTSDAMHLAFHQNGTILAAGDVRVRLWAVPSGRPIATFGHEQRSKLGSGYRGSGISTLVFTADGRRLVTGGYDGSAMIWDVVGMTAD